MTKLRMLMLSLSAVGTMAIAGTRKLRCAAVAGRLRLPAKRLSFLSDCAARLTCRRHEEHPIFYVGPAGCPEGSAGNGRRPRLAVSRLVANLTGRRQHGCWRKT